MNATLSTTLKLAAWSVAVTALLVWSAPLGWLAFAATVPYFVSVMDAAQRREGRPEV